MLIRGALLIAYLGLYPNPCNSLSEYRRSSLQTVIEFVDASDLEVVAQLVNCWIMVGR